MHYNIALEAEKYFYFLRKKLSTAGMGMRRGFPNSLGMKMRFDFSSSLGIDRVTRVEYENGEGKIRVHPASLSCLIMSCRWLITMTYLSIDTQTFGEPQTHLSYNL